MKLTRFVLPAAAAVLLPLVTGCSTPPSALAIVPRRGDIASRVQMNNPGPHQIIVNAPALDENGQPLTTASGRPLRVRLHIFVGVPTGASSKSQYAVERDVSKDEPTNDVN